MASFSSTLMSTAFDDVMKSGPGTSHVEHTSHLLSVSPSHNRTNTPLPQELCSNSTAERTCPGCDLRRMRTLHLNDVTVAVSWPPGAVNVSSMCPSSLVTVRSEAKPGCVQLLWTRQELWRRFSATLLWTLPVSDDVVMMISFLPAVRDAFASLLTTRHFLCQSLLGCFLGFAASRQQRMRTSGTVLLRSFYAIPLWDKQHIKLAISSCHSMLVSRQAALELPSWPQTSNK